GGEVGGTLMNEAYRMSVDEEAWQAYLRADKSEQAAIVERASGMPAYTSPYMPRASSASSYVLNSVGVSGVRSLRGRRWIEAMRVLRHARAVSVRDSASASYLRWTGIRHTLVPDLV